MSVFLKNIEWISDKMKTIGAGCLVGMALLTCVDVVGRFFRHPIFGSVEIVGYMATMAVAMALPYTHRIDGHVGVEIMVRLFSARAQAIIDICTRFLSLGLFVLVTWRMAVYAHTMQESGEVSMNLKFPEYLIIYVVAFCLFIFTMVIIQDIAQHLKKLKEI
jgi:TRAP-type C4-dicarboxylate transport system permease small subunit